MRKLFEKIKEAITGRSNRIKELESTIAGINTGHAAELNRVNQEWLNAIASKDTRIKELNEKRDEAWTMVRQIEVERDTLLAQMEELGQLVGVEAPTMEAAEPSVE